MTWIKTIPASEAGPELQAALDFQRTLFPPEYAERVPAAGREHSSGVVASHSLIPEALRHAFGTYGVLLSPDLPLTRRQHEMIAVVVSQANRCGYCFESHVEFLRRVTLDDALAEALRRDFRTAPITEAERVMLEYVELMTRQAERVTPEHHARLRAAGFDDRGILQITLIAAWYSYINRVADALGVGKE
jgi:uncharacterized peroxidase-related enzyme